MHSLFNNEAISQCSPLKMTVTAASTQAAGCQLMLQPTREALAIQKIPKGVEDTQHAQLRGEEEEDDSPFFGWESHPFKETFEMH
jgi:hypothetical protein